MNLNDFDTQKLNLQPKQKQTKEQRLYEAVLAAAIAADRQGLFLEVQTILDQDPALRAEDVELIFPSERFQNAMEKRGIKTTKNPNLSLRQETFLQAYLNPLNLLTPQVLAKRMKISLTELDGWMRQKAFGEAMSSKAEDNLRKYIPIADQALGQLVQSGDMKAITFLNQLTGRFDPNARSGSIDIPAMLMQVQDLILRYVTDPAAKRNIARGLMALAQGQSAYGVIDEPQSASTEVDIIDVTPEQ